VPIKDSLLGINDMLKNIKYLIYALAVVGSLCISNIIVIITVLMILIIIVIEKKDE